MIRTLVDFPNNQKEGEIAISNSAISWSDLPGETASDTPILALIQYFVTATQLWEKLFGGTLPQQDNMTNTSSKGVEAFCSYDTTTVCRSSIHE